jgi:hypothetical protein
MGAGIDTKGSAGSTPLSAPAARVLLKRGAK